MKKLDNIQTLVRFLFSDKTCLYQRLSLYLITLQNHIVNSYYTDSFGVHVIYLRTYLTRCRVFTSCYIFVFKVFCWRLLHKLQVHVIPHVSTFMPVWCWGKSEKLFFLCGIFRYKVLPALLCCIWFDLPLHSAHVCSSTQTTSLLFLFGWCSFSS